jgi:hypothetical protein
MITFNYPTFTALAFCPCVHRFFYRHPACNTLDGALRSQGGAGHPIKGRGCPCGHRGRFLHCRRGGEGLTPGADNAWAQLVAAIARRLRFPKVKGSPVGAPMQSLRALNTTSQGQTRNCYGFAAPYFFRVGGGPGGLEMPVCPAPIAIPPPARRT